MHAETLRSPLLLAALYLAVGAGAARAQVSCGGPGEVFAQCPATTGFSFSDVASGVRSADDFTLAAPADLTRIRWWGTYADGAGTAYCGPQPDLFVVQLWSDSGGTGPDPAGLVADLSARPLTRSASPVSQLTLGAVTYPIYEYELDLSASPQAIAAGVKYWLEIHNDLTVSGTCLWAWIVDATPSNGFYSYTVHWPGQPPWSSSTFPYATPGFDFAFCLIEQAGSVSYCTAGISASGCAATLSTGGVPSASAPSGFVLSATSVEGNKDGLYFFGTNGRQASSWGNGSSLQCVVPPVKRGGLLSASGSNGACNGVFGQDLNALWTATPAKNPGAGAVVQAQLWYRDPVNTSNQTTSLSRAIEFVVGP